MFTHTLPQTASVSPLQFGPFSSDGRYGLPNSVREALLQTGKGEAALVIDALLYVGFAAHKVFTFQRALTKLCEVGLRISEALVRRALKSGLFQIDALHTHRRGRPTLIYHMPSVAELVKEYADGKLSATDPLILSDLPNLRLYRQALHREFIRRAPGTYSRAFLAQRLGVGKRTTRNYDLRVGIRSVRRLSEANLRWISNWEQMIECARAGVNWLRIRFTDGRWFDAPLLLGIAQRHLWKAGVEGVYLVTQLCNRYVFSPDVDWADYQFLRLHDDDRAFAASDDPYHLRDQRIPSDPQSATLMIDRKAYQAISDPISPLLPPEVRARRTIRNPFAAPRPS